MAQKISVMIVDDSSTYRELLRSTLGEDPRIEVVAQAVNGRLAIPRVKYYKPDFVILDQEMPEMNGLETLREIRAVVPDCRVIMFCAASVEGATTALKALQEGAFDFVTKPEPGAVFPAYVRENIVERMLQGKRMPIREKHQRAIPQIKTPRPAREKTCYICGLGISTGGPMALRELLSRLSADIRGSVLIVQHMPPLFTKQLAESLSRITKLRVKEAENDELVTPATVYIAPGGKQMRVKETGTVLKIQITDEPPLYNCRPSVNVLFSSLANLRDAGRAMGVIMTGMGNDGTEGMRAMHSRGSFLMAQNQESCLIYGMPSQPVEEGLVDEVGNIEKIANRMSALLGAK